MKPTIHSTVERTGNISGEAVTMTVDLNAMEHIMGLLTDLYSDPELAVIREYSTNALDSHIEAGNSAPIEISTPGPLNPFFRVKDYGIGLDADSIRNIYSKYGASTKRGTDAQVGMLGLGCKSALTYAPQFTLVGVKNGIKTVVLISRDERGRGNMEIVEILDTDEPNGAEIMIPVKGRNEFIEKATNFFRFWKPGTVLVNGKQPMSPALTLIKDDLYIADRELGDFVIMGNVAYPVKPGVLTQGYGYSRKYSVVAHVPIGAVHFPPSREALQYTDHTNRNLAILSRTVEENIHLAIEREVSQAETAEQAINTYNAWIDMIRNNRYFIGGVSWRGNLIETLYTVTNMFGYSIGARGGNTALTRIDYRQLSNTSLRIIGFNEPDLLPKHKSKIRAWVNGNNSSPHSILVMDKLPGAPFTNHLSVVQWQDIQNFKPVRQKNVGGKRVVTDWPIVGPQGYVDESGIIDSTKTIYYIERKRRVSFPGIKEILPDNSQLVAIPGSRVTSFHKQYPKAVNLETYLRQKTQDAIDSLTEVDYAKMSLTSHDLEILKHVKAELLLDDELAKLALVAQGAKYSSGYNDYVTANNRLEKFGFTKIQLAKVEQKVILNVENYPLLSAVSWWQIRDIKGHIELYLNAVYNSKKGSN